MLGETCQSISLSSINNQENIVSEKFKYYIEGLFATAPSLDGITALKEALNNRMSEEYQSYLQEGLDEQTAYERVIEGIGDIKKLVAYLQDGQDKESTPAKEAPRTATPPQEQPQTEGHQTEGQVKENPQDGAESSPSKITEMVRNFSDVTSGILMSMFNKNDPKDIKLVNKINLPLDGVDKIKINYLSESITLKQSQDNTLQIQEYMSRSEPELFAKVSWDDKEVQIRHGRRKGFFLRSRIEVSIPADWKGTLAVSNVNFDITSRCDWHLDGFIAKSVGGSIEIKSIIADTVKLFSSVGSLIASHCSGEMDLNTSNGAIRVQEAEGRGAFSSLSGNIHVNLKKQNGMIRLSSETGEIHLRLSQKDNVELNAVSVTGAISSSFGEPGDHPLHNRFHGILGKFPYHDIEISTTTGNIFIYHEDNATE